MKRRVPLKHYVAAAVLLGCAVVAYPALWVLVWVLDRYQEEPRK